MPALKFTDPDTGQPSLLSRLLLGLLGIALMAISVPIHTVLYGTPLALAFVLGALHCGALPLAVRMPRLAVALSLTAVLLLQSLSSASVDGPWPWSVTLLITQSAVIAVLALTARWSVAIMAWLLSVLVSALVIAATIPRYPEADGSVANTVVFTCISGGALGISLLLAQRRSIRAQLVHERQTTAAEQARRELMEERNRIARELHDVVAHGMSVIQVQATSARYRLSGMDETTASEFDEIGATARTALTEMRQLLGVLRSTDPAELGPQPSLHDIPGLVESSRRAGNPVTLAWSPDITAHPTPGPVALAAYRIVQESISNVVRHAPEAETLVAVERESGSVRVTVRNEPPPRPPLADRDRGGHGLVGMRERVALLGGTLEHGPTPEGGYRVCALLPSPDPGTAPGRESTTNPHSQEKP
ncbi:hypothetical protein GCM10022198_09370 [Klugiella xanthotipulae]|uniref:histidine kinase n=1 Tax=Klugiella xanthotipulae TaxID=244735 RepID=A0A543I6R4_9MICO|nr:sensor histidine kinase [Klugiella xanthotipulae]TQM66284.1 signal transduction histidine kinase [Klugiella xanthotipulae]